MITCRNLTHYYGKRLIYENLSFDVPKGRILGLLGKNGTGKTTTINILSGFLKPYAGECRIFGEEVQSMKPTTRREIGMLMEGHVQYTFMNIEQIERFYAAFYPKWNREVYYELIPQKAGSEVTFQLRTDNNESIPAGVNVAIYTSNLKPADADASLYTEGESTTGGGHYYLYKTIEGEDNLHFVTTKAHSEETVRFSTVGQSNTVDYKSCIIELSNYREWEFNANDINIDYGIGNNVDLSFDIAPYQSEPTGDIPSESIDPGEDFYV